MAGKSVTVRVETRATNRERRATKTDEKRERERGLRVKGESGDRTRLTSFHEEREKERGGRLKERRGGRVEMD
jgi:hypothetical protein